MFPEKNHPNMKAWKTTLPVFAIMCGRFSQQQEKELVIRKHHPKRDQEEVAMPWGKGIAKNSQNMGWECGLFRRTSRYVTLRLKPIFLWENPFLSTAGNFSRRRYKISRHWLGNIGRLQAFCLASMRFWRDDFCSVPFLAHGHQQPS